MSDERGVELGEVAQTLMVPLWCRAVETERRRPLLRDPQLAHAFPASEFVFDTVTRAAAAPRQRPMMNSYEVPFVWGCDDPHEIEAWGGHRSLARTTMADLPYAVRRLVPLEHRLAWPYLRLFRGERLRSHALNHFALGPDPRGSI